MAHAIWKGSITFGLVNIPVALHSASEGDDLRFSMLDRHDHSPVGYERVNKKTGKPVAWDDIVKGYKIGGEYVLVTDADFERANVEATHTVQILDFVEGSKIEPIYYDQPYYLVPPKAGSKGGAAHKGYVLLRETLKRTGKVGVAKVVIRAREHLAALMVRGPLLLLDLMRFHHQVRQPDAFDLPAEPRLSEGELRMAERLVAEMTSEWNPEQYRDEYRDDLMAMIEKKAAGGEAEEIPETREKRPTSKVVDLMPLLKQSLEARQEKPVKPAVREERSKASSRKSASSRPSSRKRTRTRKSA
ncbi:MAG: end-binding protein Ku [Candidatus Binatota bacterium]|jgi:DNA end-binding protein Ku|nr:end-binding protein Ku [Candidatus Binatota bacterium]